MIRAESFDRGAKMMTRITGAFVGLTAVIATAALAQPGGFGGFNQRMQAVLAEPFVGLTDNGTVETGLFTIEATGVGTEGVRVAAEHFLASLSNEQRERAMFPVGDSEWRNWANVHLFQRQGVSLLEMTEAQRGLAYELVRACLSERGYKT